MLISITLIENEITMIKISFRYFILFFFLSLLGLFTIKCKSNYSKKSEIITPDFFNIRDTILLIGNVGGNNIVLKRSYFILQDSLFYSKNIKIVSYKFAASGLGIDAAFDVDSNKITKEIKKITSDRGVTFVSFYDFVIKINDQKVKRKDYMNITLLN